MRTGRRRGFMTLLKITFMPSEVSSEDFFLEGVGEGCDCCGDDLRGGLGGEEGGEGRVGGWVG